MKCYWAQWERLFVKNGLLYRKWLEQSEKQPIYQLIVPKCLRNEVLSLLHEQKCSGHLGIRKVIGRLRRRFYWVSFKTDDRTGVISALSVREEISQASIIEPLLNSIQ